MNEPWKVIATDNFARESVADWLVSEGHSEEEAQAIAAEKNRTEGGDGASWFYEAVPASRRLWGGMEELV